MPASEPGERSTAGPASATDPMPALPASRAALRRWLRDGAARSVVTPAALDRARAVVLQGWQQRAAERGRPVPADLSSACKFSSLLVHMAFGGAIRGNADHQYNLVDGQVIDLTAGSEDLRQLRAAGADPYRHDPAFFGNPDHLDSLLSCLPRAADWLHLYTAAGEPALGADSADLTREAAPAPVPMPRA